MADHSRGQFSDIPFRAYHDAALNEVRKAGGVLRSRLRNDMKKFFERQNWKLESTHITRLAYGRLSEDRKYVKEGVTYVENRLREFLTEERANEVHAAVERLLTRSQLPTSYDLTEHAIQHLFGMSSSHYSVSTEIEGEYFGYRRNAHDGQIIRFHIKIRHSKEEGLLRFRNQYRRGHNQWLVRGSGFEVKGTFYLIGNAVLETHEATGLGMRCFALQPHARYGWFVGLLISTDDHLAPIAARIVLVPAKQHAKFESLTGEGRQRKLMVMITDTIEVEDLDDEIQVVGTYDSAPCSAELQALIWNGTFTTLMGRQRRLDTSWLPDYEDLFAFQARAVRLGLDKNMEMAPFIQIARHGAKLIPNEPSGYKQVLESIKPRRKP